MRSIPFLLALVCLYTFTTCNSLPGKPKSPATDSLRYKKLTAEAFNFCKRKGFDTTFFILCDMSIHSGSNRLFIWKFGKQQAEMGGLVTHGCGKESWSDDDTKNTPMFSNTPDSHLSSLGKYKIGERGYSQWGIHVKYLLHGLDSTNSNALKRTIVLHSWEAVPDEEITPTGAPESWGCPAVSDNYMKKLDNALKSTDKPVLLWIVN